MGTVEAAETLEASLDKSDHVGFFADVGLLKAGLASLAFDQATGLLAALDVDVAHEHARSLAREQKRGFASDAGCAVAPKGSRNRELLVGVEVWEGAQLETVSIGSVNNCAFGGFQLPGFVDGNSVIIRVYDASEGAEVDTAPYVCRKTSPDTATIWGVVNKLGLGVLPSSKTAQVKAQLDPVFPGIQSFPDVMACGLAAMNPVVHPAGVLLNAGRVEYSKGEFYFYEEGVTPSVAKVIQQVDQERRDVAQGLGYKLPSVNEAFYHAGFGPKGDLWATIHGSWMLTQLKAPGTLESRWLTEDIPYGLAAWSSLGEQYGTKTPTMRSLVDIGSIIMGFNGWEESRDVKRLGISEMDKTELSILLKTGKIVADCN